MTKWLTSDEWEAVTAQARELREQAKKGGLQFETYLSPVLAEWVLGLVEQRAFTSPAEAVWVLLKEAMELEPHTDLRQELLKRRVAAAIDDPRPSVSGEEFMERMMAEMKKPQPAPARWPKLPNPETVEAMEAARRDELITAGGVNGLLTSLNADD